MKNVFFKSKEELEARGYEVRENSENSECDIFKDGEEVVKIRMDEEALLEVQVKGKVMKDLLGIEIHASNNPKTVLLEMEGKYIDKIWCEIPPKGERIFW